MQGQLRKIDKVLDLSFLKDLTAPLYVSEIGRPSIDPEVFVRMVLLEYLYNINPDGTSSKVPTFPYKKSLLVFLSGHQLMFF